MAIGCKLYGMMHILWHIMPGRERLVKSLIVDDDAQEYVDELNAMYNFHLYKPLIMSMLAKKFSSDVAKVINLYLPQMYRDEYGKEMKKRRKSYGSMHSQSSSPHLAIDCVDPLPPMSTYCSTNNSSNGTPQRGDELSINMTAPNFAIPIDCDDPLTLLRRQSLP